MFKNIYDFLNPSSIVGAIACSLLAGVILYFLFPQVAKKIVKRKSEDVNINGNNNQINYKSKVKKNK
ncbi:MAG: hypothetical protein JWM44_3607 [Bacilli bacterium]|nr:hypothetical protein [Bacilli bacterium]